MFSLVEVSALHRTVEFLQFRAGKVSSRDSWCDQGYCHTLTHSLIIYKMLSCIQCHCWSLSQETWSARPGRKPTRFRATILATKPPVGVSTNVWLYNVHIMFVEIENNNHNNIWPRQASVSPLHARTWNNWDIM